jgi:GntR family transcriptional repressor for pyruvate dehydrogenase complex
VTNPENSTADMFSRVTVDRVSQVIVDQIRLLIREGRLSTGDRLPSERDLCQRFGVSRVTVREALRVLEASGLVEVRVGARGGAFVTSPTAARLGAGLADLMTLSPLTAANVTEARQIVELGILPLVVERATEDDITELMELVERSQEAVDRNEYTMALSAEFHIRVSMCAHNPAIEMLVQSFHGPMLMSMRQAQMAAPLMGHRGTDEHRLLVQAIADRNTDAAVDVMRTHLDRTAGRVAETTTPA